MSYSNDSIRTGGISFLLTGQNDTENATVVSAGISLSAGTTLNTSLRPRVKNSLKKIREHA